MIVSDYDPVMKVVRVEGKSGNVHYRPIAVQLDRLLNEYCLAIDRTYSTTPWRYRWLFPGREKLTHLSPRQVNHLFLHWRQQARLRGDLTVHSFRAGFASTLYEETGDLVLVCKALGHCSPVTTLGYLDISYKVEKIINDFFFSPERD